MGMGTEMDTDTVVTATGMDTVIFMAITWTTMVLVVVCMGISTATSTVAAESACRTISVYETVKCDDPETVTTCVVCTDEPLIPVQIVTFCK
jgi:hypothetical protein